MRLLIVRNEDKDILGIISDLEIENYIKLSDLVDNDEIVLDYIFKQLTLRNRIFEHSGYIFDVIDV